MRPCLTVYLLLCLIFPATGFSQVTTLFESFEDRNLSSDPAWHGDVEDFIFVSDTASADPNTLLRLDASPEPSRTQIYTESSVSHGAWEFIIRQDVTPSNFNRAFFFLMADRSDLNYLDGSRVNGYAIRTGDNDSPRRFRLVRFDDGDQTELIASDITIREYQTYVVRVTRSDSGEWRLYISEGRNSIPEFQASPVADTTHNHSTHTGFLLRYSSGNVQNFYFDDIRIENSAPFELTGAEVVTSQTIEAEFSYPLDEESIQPADFSLTDLGQPANVQIGRRATILTLTYPGIIPDGDYSLRVTNILSAFGSRLADPQTFTFSFKNPFDLISAEIRSARAIHLSFNKHIAPDYLIPDQFLINGSVVPTSVSSDTSTISLHFGSDLPSGEVLIRMDGVWSRDGWRLPDNTTLSTFRFGDPSPGNIVINEILYRRSETDANQFVELFNTAPVTYDLSGWKLETGRGSALLPDGTVMEPGAHLVLADLSAGLENVDNLIILNGWTPLRTTAETLVLKTPGLITIDSLAYHRDWGGYEPGISLERRDPSAISTDPANWQSATEPSGATPGLINSVFEKDITPPSLLFAALSPDRRKVTVRFDEFVDLEFTPDLELTNHQIDGIHQSGADRHELHLTLADAPVTIGKEIVLSADRVSDHQSNLSGAVSFPVAQPVSEGVVVFNEIMYDPLDDDRDQMPNQSDYLELVNRKPYAVSLEGVFIHDGPDENGNISPVIPISTHSKWIPANGYALIYPETEPVAVDSSRTGQFFNLNRSMESHTLQIDRNTLSLPISGRMIYLSDSTGAAVDSVHYSDEWHNPNLFDTKGIALERILPEGPGNDERNWGSSTVPAGGSPGSQNSIYQVPDEAGTNRSIQLQPNPFSPDGDGFEDHLLISYSFEEPDYILRVRIFDRYGRHIRTLADSHHAGFEGSLIWDGLHDHGVTARVGIYIIQMEAYNSSTGNSEEFREIAVLARKF